MSRDLGENWWLLFIVIIIAAAILGNKYIDRKYPEPPEEGELIAQTYFPTMEFDYADSPAAIQVIDINADGSKIVFTMTVSNNSLPNYTFNYAIASKAVIQAAENVAITSSR